LDAQEVEKEFEWSINAFKHRFIDFTTVAFKDDQKAHNEFTGPFAYQKNFNSANSSKSLFRMPRMPKIISHGTSTP
jgi:hypothetical protein